MLIRRKGGRWEEGASEREERERERSDIPSEFIFDIEENKLTNDYVEGFFLLQSKF